MTFKYNTFKGIVKSGKPQNVVLTSTQMNMAAALECETLREAEVLIRRLEHANDRGTGESTYAELERRYYEKHGHPAYLGGI